MGLMVHCGGRKVGFEEVQKSVTPDPVGAHYPIPHSRILELVTEGLQKQGLHVVDQEHALDANGMRYFGLLKLVNGSNHDDYGLIAGVRNTHDKTFAASMALGSHVFVCDNLAFSGEVTFARRHTRFAMSDMPRLVDNALGRLGNLKRSQEIRIEGYKGTVLNDDQAYAAILRGSLSQIISNARIKDVVKEWHNPTHDAFLPRTGWSLFNAFTEILKTYQAQEIPKRTLVLHGLMDTACRLTLDISKHVEVVDDSDVAIMN